MVDRTVLCNAAAAGSGIVSLLPAYNGTAYRSAVQDTYEYDIEAAYKLLTDEGYRRNEEDGYWYYYDGTALIIDAIVPASSFELCTVMRNVKSAMEKLGITVELQELTDEDFAVKYQKKQYMIMPMQVELGSWIDLEKIFETGGELNCSFYSNASVDSYFKQIKSLGASDVIAAGYGEIEKILLDENPIIGLYINNDSIVVRDSVKGIARGTVYAWNPLANFYKWGITEENT